MPTEPNDVFAAANLRNAETRRLEIIQDLLLCSEGISEIIKKLEDTTIDSDIYSLYIQSNTLSLIERLNGTLAKINRNAKYVAAKQLIATIGK